VIHPNPQLSAPRLGIALALPSVNGGLVPGRLFTGSLAPSRHENLLEVGVTVIQLPGAGIG